MIKALTFLPALFLAALTAPAAAQDAPPASPDAQEVTTPATTAAQAEPSAPTADNPTAAPKTELVAINTTMGTITLALEVERAPITAANFLRYADEKRFDGTVFYRAMHLKWGEQPNGLIQGGTQNDPARILPGIAHEPTNETGVKHTKGAISMAMLEPGTSTGDWSILLGDMYGLDADPDNEDPARRAGYAAFGHVVDGMEVVEAIWGAPIDPDKGEGWMKGQMLSDPVKILSVRRVEAAQEEAAAE